jgi:hypothetical protein
MAKQIEAELPVRVQAGVATLKEALVVFAVLQQALSVVVRRWLAAMLQQDVSHRGKASGHWAELVSRRTQLAC